MNNAQTGDALLTLVERSGLLSADQLSAYRMGAEDPLEVARVLVRDRLLTPFQARQLLRGKFRGYFLTEKYKVLDELGAGGGGRVLLCEHLLLQKLVALKLLNASWTSVPGTVERFYREAKAAAAIDHPNIVRVFDIDKAQGTVPFMVMEFVDGTNFHHLVAESGPLTPHRAAEYIRQAAVGLEAARQVGLVHRDIKPANLLLDRTGLVRLTDLGLARFLGNALRRNQNLTQQFDANSVLGTLDFIAPEQADNSSAVDTRADIYSLGYTLYYLLTGKMPFGEGSAAQKLMWHQLRHPEPISSHRGDVPPELERVFERMTRKSPADRYQTPAEIAEALVPLIGDEPVPPPPAEEMPKIRATSYILGLSPTPTPDVLATPPISISPPTPTGGETAAIPRHPGRGQALATSAGAPRMSGSGSHVLTSLPAARSSEVSVGVPAPSAPLPDSAFEPATTPDRPTAAPRRNWLYSVVPVTLLLAVACALLVWQFSGKAVDNTPILPPPSNDKLGAGPVPPPNKTPEPQPPPPTASSFALTGNGSSFVDPLMQRWSDVYREKYRLTLGYTKSSSTSGVRELFQKRVAFACTDAFLTDAQLLEAKGAVGPVVHVPLVMGAVVVTYNLPSVKQPLRFTGGQLADIYLGKITRWNDPALDVTNPGARLPDLPIRVVHRSDGSGTTHIWTDYLDKVSAGWHNQVAPPVGTTVGSWPVGTGAEKNDGVADAVRKTPGAIGYVELGFALDRALPVAQVRNEGSEAYVAPNVQSVTAAANARLKAQWFKLTDAAFRALEGANVPEPVLVKLRPLKNVDSAEDDFERELARELKSEELKGYQDLIKKHARSEFPSDLRFTLTNASGEGVYPICGTTWAVLYQQQPGTDRAELIKFLRWAVHDGQGDAPKLHYVPLPPALVKRIDTVLGTVTPGP